jgi:acetyl/propionyl-CoA carboxylase alpha subunit
MKQSELRQRGHAIECRIYAEDPAQDFLPSIGSLAHYRRPGGPGVRVDDGVEQGTAVTPYYDPMLAKVITWGADRPEALRKMVRALRDMIVLGVTTNIPYLLDILREPDFVAGKTTTNYLETHFPDWQAEQAVDEALLLGTAVFEFLHGRGGPGTRQALAHGEGESVPDPWDSLPAWRNLPG